MPKLMMRHPDGDYEVRLYKRHAGGDKPVRIQRKPNAPTANPEVDYVGAILSKPRFLVAHRLLGADYPEHTMQGLEAALAAGFKAVEFSTYRTKDGVFIGSHDWTTERTTGVKHEIWNTDWATLQELNQGGGKLIRLEDMISRLPDDVVIFLDHKATSSKAANNAGDLQSETALFEKLGKLLPGTATKRVVWKVFSEASSAERARAKGYRVNAMLYPNQVNNVDLSRWDILGMEWNAPQTAWQTLTDTGKPTIGHIIYNTSQAQQALTKGARGLMVSSLSAARP